MDTSVLDLGGISVTRAIEDARAMVLETVETFEPEAFAKEIHLGRDVPVDPVEVFVDRGRVLRVLSNLTSNALKFTPPGGHITLCVERRDQKIRFCVSDTGCGISAADLRRVFDRFHHAPGNAGGGTGLGLYVARAIVEAHGGTIRAESAPGVGTTFWFTLPDSRRATSP